MFSVLFETWVARTGRNLFTLAFHLYVFPYWSISAPVLLYWMQHYNWLLHLLSLGQSCFFKLTRVQTDSGGSTEDFVKKMMQLWLVLPSSISCWSGGANWRIGTSSNVVVSTGLNKVCSNLKTIFMYFSENLTPWPSLMASPLVWL